MKTRDNVQDSSTSPDKLDKNPGGNRGEKAADSVRDADAGKTSGGAGEKNENKSSSGPAKSGNRGSGSGTKGKSSGSNRNS